MIAFIVEGIGRSGKFRPSYIHLHFHAKSVPQVSPGRSAARRFSKRCADVH
jgi:hypothetical protein